MAADHDAALERVLMANLARAIDFVKYGDAKNATLLAFASAWLAGIGNLAMQADSKLAPGVVVLLDLAEALFLTGASCALAALLPITTPQDITKRFKATFRGLFLGPALPAVPNLLFFGHVRHLNEDEFRSECALRYRPEGETGITEGLISDLCDQTLVNSRIAQRKFARFNMGLTATFAGLMAVVIAFLASTVRALFG